MQLCHSGSEKNGLKINADKTQIIVLGTRQQICQLAPIEIRFMGTTTVGTSSAKNLGVTFDESMTFSNHVTDVARRCTGILSGLSHSRHYLPKSTLATLVQALVVSSIRYAIVVYGGCGVTQMSRLQRLINFGARVVSGKRKYDHVSEVLKELRWLSAENMWRLQSVTLLKKILETGEPEALSNAIVPCQRLFRGRQPMVASRCPARGSPSPRSG